MDILDDSLVVPVRERFLQWRDFLNQNVEFAYTQSRWHTQEHCARVLMLSQVIGHALGMTEQQLDVLAAASVFHDSRRNDDGLDVGHGRRAAEYYEDFCDQGGLAYDARVAEVMAYHERDDEIGKKACAKVSEDCELLYLAFKDSDGLDRVRLGDEWLDIAMLRTEPAHGLLDFEHRLLEQL